MSATETPDAPAKPADPEAGTRLLAPDKIVFTSGDERVKLEIKGENPRTLNGFYATASFPLTAPGKMIQLYVMKDDGTTGELAGIIEDIDALDKASAGILRSVIRNARILPIIQRVEKVLDEQHSFHWWVITDRGPYDFYTGSPKEAITYTSHGQMVIEDLTGNQFTIMDVKSLDSISRMYLERAT